jgi:transposase
MLHRSRQLLVCQRTMLSNAMRGHMAELGNHLGEGPQWHGRAAQDHPP